MKERFEWDDRKAATNLRKHGVHFDAATEAFRDILGIDELDDGVHYGEQRFKLVARAAGSLVAVIYTGRGDRVRIISARHATRRGRDRYYRENS